MQQYRHLVLDTTTQAAATLPLLWQQTQGGCSCALLLILAGWGIELLRARLHC